MAKRTRKMGKGEDMSSSSEMNDDEDDMEDESEKSPKRRVKKVTVVETFARGGKVATKGCKPIQMNGRTNSGTY